MNMLRKISYSKLLVSGFITLSLGLLSVNAQSQALTPEQLTQQVRILGERSQNTVSTLKSIQQDVKKMGRLIDNRAVLELMQNVEELGSEISQMRGELEQQTHDISEIKKRQRELYLDIDRRMRVIESGASAQAAAVAPVEVPGLNEATEPAQPETPATETGVTASGSTGLIADTNTSMSTEPTSAASQASTTTSSEEQAAYQAAFDTLKEGRYKKAKTELKRFLAKYPDSSFAGNAQYWLGEAYYVTREFDQGIVEFEHVLSRYPGSSKVADAMLKLGYTYYEKKQFNKAKIMLNELRKRYPKATAARLANKRLDRMRKEGH